MVLFLESIGYVVFPVLGWRDIRAELRRELPLLPGGGGEGGAPHLAEIPIPSTSISLQNLFR